MTGLTQRILILLFLLAIAFPAFNQSASENSSPHYLFPQFKKGSVKMLRGKVNETVLNYNMVTEEMVFSQNGKMLALDQIETVDTIFIEDRKFIPVGKKFYEVAYLSPISLFIQHKKKLNPAGKPAGYGGTTQTSAVTSASTWNDTGGIYKLDLPSNYVISDASVYWIKSNDGWHSFTNERQFLKIFPERSNDIKKFIKANHLNIKKLDDLKVLMKYLNEI